MKMTKEQAKDKATVLLANAGKRIAIGEYYASDVSGYYGVYYFRQHEHPKNMILVAFEDYPADESRVSRVMRIKAGKRHYFMPGNQPGTGVELIIENFI